MDETLRAEIERRFHPTQTEWNMLEAVLDGEEAFSGAVDLGELAKVPIEWDAAYTVRASILSYLFSAPSETADTFPHKFSFRGYRIYGRLDLSRLSIPFQIAFRSCDFPEQIQLQGATVAALDFSGSSTAGINGNGVTVLKDLRFSDGFSTISPVSMMGAHIKGNLNCIGGKFTYQNHVPGISSRNPGCDGCRNSVMESYVLLINDSRIDGSLYLCGGFLTKGGLYMADTTIGGNLNCTKAIIEAKSPEVPRQERKSGRRLSCNADCEYHIGCAINCDGLRVQGSVLLNSIEVRGEMRLAGAHIGGDIESEHSKYKPSGPDAIYGDRMRVGGNIYFTTGFISEGIVRLPRAEVGADVSFRGASVKYGFSDSPALFCVGIRVNGTMYLSKFTADGGVDLSNSEVRGSLECGGSTFINRSGKALDAEGISVGRCVTLNDGFLAEGEVSFDNATIGTVFTCDRGTFKAVTGEASSRKAISAGGIKVGGSIFLREGFLAEGEVDLNDAVISRNLCCDDGKIINEDGCTLRATQVKTTGSLIMNNFTSHGMVRLDNAVIHGNVYCEAGEFICSQKDPSLLLEEMSDTVLKKSYAFNAGGVRVEGDAIFQKGLHVKGVLTLNSAEIRCTLRWHSIREADKDTILDLTTAKAQTFDDDLDSCPLQLLLNGFEYRFLKEPILIEKRLDNWMKSSAGQAFKPQPYEQLASVLRLQGYERQAHQVLIAKNERLRALRLRQENRIIKFLDRQARNEVTYRDENTQTTGMRLRLWVLGKIVCYGYKPYRALGFSLAVVIIGTLLFAAGFRSNVMEVAKEGGYRVKESVSSGANGTRSASTHAVVREAEVKTGPGPLGNQMKRSLSDDDRASQGLNGIAASVPHAGVAFPATPAAIEPATKEVSSTGPEPAKEGKEPWFDPDNNWELFGASFLYSLDTFLPVVDLQVGDHYLPAVHPHDGPFHPLGAALMAYRLLHILLGWLLTAVFVAALSGIVRK